MIFKNIQYSIAYIWLLTIGWLELPPYVQQQHVNKAPGKDGEGHTFKPVGLVKADWCSTDLTVSKSHRISFCTQRKKTQFSTCCLNAE